MFTQTNTNFGEILDINILHLTRWSDRGLQFSTVSRNNVIGHRSRFDNMHNEEDEPCIFILFIQMSITLFYKLLTHIAFSIPLDALQRVWVIFAKICIKGFQNMKCLCRFKLFPSGSMVANWQDHALIWTLSRHQIHLIILINSIKLTGKDTLTQIGQKSIMSGLQFGRKNAKMC